MNLTHWKNGKVAKSDFSTTLANSPEHMIKLSETIVRVHTSRGAGSPLSGTLAAELSFKANAAKEKHEEGMKYLKLAQEALSERDLLLGTKPGMTDEGVSLKFYLSCVLDILSTQQNSTFEIKEWGFEK